jgi:5'-methylthioadenosine phosphorylase
VSTQSQARVGVFGGTGLYQMEGLTGVRQVSVDTPFGPPSDAITIGELGGVSVAFLPRHGVGHRILPSEIPVRANVWAMKALGVERLVSVSAVGSLQEQIAPLDMVVPDQLIDRTKGRTATFFGEGLVAHVALADPFCPELSELLADAADDTEANVHRGGTYLVMEGPAFSTRAESALYRSWGASIIGMTALPEAKLAREAELCFAVLATATDYDSWHEGHEDVSVEMVMENLARNVAESRKALARLLPRIGARKICTCGDALSTALVTAKELVPPQTLERLRPIVGRYYLDA